MILVGKLEGKRSVCEPGSKCGDNVTVTMVWTGVFRPRYGTDGGLL